MQALGIVLFSIGAAITYGIIHDQITAHICVEYFSAAHPPVFPTEDPTLLAFGWGVIATWWVGLMLGVPLAIAARFGEREKRSVRTLVKPVAILLLVMAACAATAGGIGWYRAHYHHEYIRNIDHFVPMEKRDAFMIDVWAHNTSYLVGFIGGLVVVAHVWFSRLRKRNTIDAEATPRSVA